MAWHQHTRHTGRHSLGDDGVPFVCQRSGLHHASVGTGVGPRRSADGRRRRWPARRGRARGVLRAAAARRARDNDQPPRHRLLEMHRQPDQWRALCAEPSLLDNGIDELLRFVSPVQFVGRVALEPILIDGLEIGKGETVLPIIGGANLRRESSRVRANSTSGGVTPAGRSRLGSDRTSVSASSWPCWRRGSCSTSWPRVSRIWRRTRRRRAFGGSLGLRSLLSCTFAWVLITASPDDPSGPAEQVPTTARRCGRSLVAELDAIRGLAAGWVHRHGSSAWTPPASGPTSIRLGSGKGGATTDWIEAPVVDGEAFGRSRGGLTARSISPPTAAASPMSIILTPARPGTTHTCCRCWIRSGSAATDPADHASVPTGCWPTRPTPTPRPGRRCASAGSRSPARRKDQPDRPPRRERLPRRTPAHVRPEPLRRPQRRQAVFQPAQAVPRPGHRYANAPPTTDPRSSSPRSCYGCAPAYRTRPRQACVCRRLQTWSSPGIPFNAGRV